MQKARVRAKLKEFEVECHRRGVRLTTQRRVILEAVLERDDHPTADQLYEVVRDRIPGVSRTTVYRVLNTLVEIGAVRKLHHGGGVVRFDGNTARHHHLICRKCNKVIDVESEELNGLSLPDVGTEGFEIDDFSVQLIGTCAACRRADGR